MKKPPQKSMADIFMNGFSLAALVEREVARAACRRDRDEETALKEHEGSISNL